MRRAALLLPVVAAIALLASGGAAAQSAAPLVASDLGARYVANEGFLVEGGGKRVLIDGLFGDGVSGYPVSPAGVRDRLERGVGEWAGIGVALATHFHPDHFDPGSVGRFLEANPGAVFISTPQAVAKLRETYPDAPGLFARARAVLPAEGSVERLEIDDIGIEVLNLHHGLRDPPVQNLGFIVTLGGERFLHFGDTEAKIDDFVPYLERLADVDLALLPFWFLSSAWRAEMVRDRIRPRRIVVAHLPLPTAPGSYFGRWQSYENLVRTIRDGFPQARFPRSSGETLDLTAD